MVTVDFSRRENLYDLTMPGDDRHYTYWDSLENVPKPSRAALIPALFPEAVQLPEIRGIGMVTLLYIDEEPTVVLQYDFGKTIGLWEAKDVVTYPLHTPIEILDLNPDSDGMVDWSPSIGGDIPPGSMLTNRYLTFTRHVRNIT